MTKKKTHQFKTILSRLISDVFEKSGNKALNYKQVAGQLNINDAESRELILELLKEQARTGILQEPEKGKFKLKELKTFVTGIVDLTADGSAYIVVEDEFENDIFIAPRKLRTALHGDTVKVYVYAKNKGKRKEGEVMEIISRAKMEFTGIIKVSEKFAFFIPDAKRLKKTIRFFCSRLISR